MSDGGLLQKAIEQQSAGQEESVLVADVGSSSPSSCRIIHCLQA